MAKIRVLRVLEYIGEEKDVWNTLSKGGVPANGQLGPFIKDGIIIKSGLVGFPDYGLEEEGDVKG